MSGHQHAHDHSSEHTSLSESSGSIHDPDSRANGRVSDEQQDPSANQADFPEQPAITPSSPATEHDVAMDDRTNGQSYEQADVPFDRRRGRESGKSGDSVTFLDGRMEKIRDARIMIVDDVRVNALTIRNNLTKHGFRNFTLVNDARSTLGVIRKQVPDVILLDIWMPDINGLDILRVLSLEPAYQHIPVLIVTSDTDPDTRRAALELGATDFLGKPIDVYELIPRVRNALLIKNHQDNLTDQKQKLERQVRLRTSELLASRQQLILSLARAAEHRDNETGNHVIRVGRYVGLIAEALGFAPEKIAMLELAAQLHDVGKIGIPDAILFKEGRLDPSEYELIKSHCALGKEIIEPIQERDFAILRTHTRIGESILHVRDSPLLILAARIAQTHHEHWDGSGYPLGLAGEDIPIEGRMTTVADVFDALSTRRTYKPAFPRKKCFEIMEAGRGKQFDPLVLDAFVSRADQIVDVQMSLMDAT